MRFAKDQTIDFQPIDVLYMRCVHHATVPQLNAEGGDGEECAACIAQDVAYARQQAGRLYNVLASILTLLDDQERALTSKSYNVEDGARVMERAVTLRGFREEGLRMIRDLQPMFFAQRESTLLDAEGKKVDQ